MWFLLGGELDFPSVPCALLHAARDQSLLAWLFNITTPMVACG